LDAGLPGFEDSPSWTLNWNLTSTKDWLDEGYVYEEDKMTMTATPASRSTHVFNDEGTLSIWGSWQGSIVFCSGQLHEVSEIAHRKTDATSYLAHLQNIRSLICVISAFRAQSRIVGRDETLSSGIFELLQARISSRIGLEHQKNFDAWYTIMTDTEYKADEFSAKIGQTIEDYRGRQPEHTDFTDEELQIKMMTDPECIEALEQQQKVDRRQRRQRENTEEKQTKRDKHEPVKIEQTLEDYGYKHPEYTELNAEELQVKMMTDPKCIEMLEQEKWERQKRREAEEKGKA
jgi:hypothetical protein